MSDIAVIQKFGRITYRNVADAFYGLGSCLFLSLATVSVIIQKIYEWGESSILLKALWKIIWFIVVAITMGFVYFLEFLWEHKGWILLYGTLIAFIAFLVIDFHLFHTTGESWLGVKNPDHPTNNQTFGSGR